MTTVMAARRYFLDGATKSAIATELGISRFKVARLIEDAVRDGVVRIEIEPVPDIDIGLSRELAVSSGIRSAVVVRTAVGSADLERAMLGRAAATLLVETIETTDILGVSWGRTLHAIAAYLPVLPRCTVVQIVGGVPSLELDVNSLELVRRFAERAGGPVFPLHVPLVVEDPDVAAALRADPNVSATLAMFPRLTRAIVGIGAWEPGGSTVRAGLSGDASTALDAAGAVADVCAIPLDREGRLVRSTGLEERSISITPEQLRAVPDVVAISGGATKVMAIRAAIRSGLIHRLVTTEETARLLLADA
ncbi:MAG: transcriptional regulator [Chloroflexi bacterium]|nr:transcriptional regulator [Chloroflexota bacterium]MBA3586012.1 transcriptional regulator [Chloroflexota bacterium]